MMSNLGVSNFNYHRSGVERSSTYAIVTLSVGLERREVSPNQCYVVGNHQGHPVQV